MIRRGLEAVARRAAWFMAGGLVIGFALPAVADLFRPAILFAMLGLLTIAMIRLDVERLKGYARRPGMLAVVVVVTMVAAPLAMWVFLRPVAVPEGLEQGLILMAAAPMISSAIALAIILGLDAALAVAVMVATYAVTPLTLPALSLWLGELDLGVGFLELSVRLFAMIAIPATLAFVVRKWILGRRRQVAWAHAIDGIGALVMVVFCVGIMAGLQGFAFARPDYVLLTLAAAFAANIGFQALGTLVFLRLGRREALTIGLVAGNTNLGLVMVTLADKASPELIAYFVLGQVPMYFLPVFTLPVYRRIIAAGKAA